MTEINRAFGRVPNLFRMLSNAPAALDGYVKFNAALAQGALGAVTRERIALAIAKNRGRAEEKLFGELISVGYSAAEIIEIIAQVALNNFTNFVNEALGTGIDFPEATNLAA